MTIDKYQIPNVKVDISTVFAHIGLVSIYQTFFSETTWSAKLKFHMETAYDRELKFVQMDLVT